VTKINPEDTDYVIEGAGAGDELASVPKTVGGHDDQFWIGLATVNLATGQNYQNAALTNQWERNADHFNNKHYRRSAYTSKLYAGRSRLFRPLTRSVERSGAAQFAAAMFSNLEIIDITPENGGDPEQLASARMIKHIMKYRLEKTIPWYLTALGAWQDTRVYGPCATYTTWEYREQKVKAEAGEKTEFEEAEVLSDKPVIEMIPPEGLLVDPACDWRDPINSSPYVLRLVPMYVVDVEDRMKDSDESDAEPWINLTREQILSAGTDRYNQVRQAREGDNRPDKFDSQDRPEFKIVMAIENFVRLDGKEWVYWTLGSYLLSKPIPLKQAYVVGRRPITYGFSVVEAHKFSPSSPTELISQLQMAINDTANLRMDNVRLALNKRYILRRGSAIDLDALMASVPGGGIYTNDPERDVKVVTTSDVTGSSYKEQERLETESNDITGSFTGASIQNNRALNETVGGMEMLAEGSNAISEFDIRTFAETFMKPQLELLMAYIRMNETDDVLLNMAFQEARKVAGFEAPGGEDEEDTKKRLIERMRKDAMTLRVNVGLGATSPQRKSDTLSRTVGIISQNPDQAKRIDWDEVTLEQFAANGYGDGKRFLLQDEEGESGPTEEDLQAAYEQGQSEGADQAKMADVEARREIAMAKLDLDRELGFAKIALTEGITMAQLQTKLDVETKKDATRRDTAAMQAQSTTNELEFKRTTGKPGV